jgi:hypothetical protein
MPRREALSLVGRPDAAARRADLGLAEPMLARAVEVAVVRHDEMRVAADEQAVGGELVGLEAVHLLDEHLGVDDAPVADDRRDVRVHDAARNEVQLERAAAVDDGVARVVAALEADDVVEVVGDQVGDLALALVAPLGADKNDSGRGRNALVAGGLSSFHRPPQDLLDLGPARGASLERFGDIE